MDYSVLNRARLQHTRQHGETATAAIVIKHGGTDDDGNAVLSRVPQANWPALAQELGGQPGANTGRSKSIAEIVPAAYDKWNKGFVRPDHSKAGSQ